MVSESLLSQSFIALLA